MTSWDAILEHVGPALLVMFRLGGLTIYAPVFGSPVVLTRLKVFLCLLIGLAAYPAIAARSGIGAVPLELFSLAPLIALELAIGLVLGFMAGLPLIAAQCGGLIIGQQVGLGFGRIFNPALDDESDVLGQMLFFLALAGFLLVGGHEGMVLAVLHSFDRLPPGGFVPDGALLSVLNAMLLSALELALRIAAPLLALVFLESVALGFIARTVPQLNILSLGFPLRILLGLLILAVGLLIIDEVLMEAIDQTLRTMLAWVEP
jgi:flagellar biosynthetic protein FliR